LALKIGKKKKKKPAGPPGRPNGGVLGGDAWVVRRKAGQNVGPVKGFLGERKAEGGGRGGEGGFFRKEGFEPGEFFLITKGGRGGPLTIEGGA